MFKYVISLCWFWGTLVAGASEVVYEVQLGDFSQASYTAAVEGMFQAWEVQTGRALVPGEKRRVGLKVYTNSGPGLATPKALVDGVIKALERRGFEREQLFIFDLEARYLRQAGFLPPLSVGGGAYQGVPVYALEKGVFYDALWFYDSPLPARARLTLDYPWLENAEATEDDRKSFVPVPLVAEADFWINLPMIVDVSGLGVSGALANATLWNASNTRRFFRNPASAPVAVAEMAAIPELRQPWVFTIATLERYQFIGGPAFNSLYTASEPLLWMSTNPNALDYLFYERMNRWRKERELPLIEPLPPLFDYAQALGLGSWSPQGLSFRAVMPVR